MNLVKPSYKIIRATPDGLNAIEEAARTCYLSEPKDTKELRNQFYGTTGLYVTNNEADFRVWVQKGFLTKIRKMGHQTPFEFMDIEIEFICDRGVSHEAVRHRLCSPMQESTRYCNYSADRKHGMNVIPPSLFKNDNPKQTVAVPLISTDGQIVTSVNYQQKLNDFDVWVLCMSFAEWGYNTLLSMGHSPQWARSVCPTSLKTTLKIKANVREWWHIFQLRAINPGAHPQIREVMLPALEECAELWPVLFGHMLTKE